MQVINVNGGGNRMNNISFIFWVWLWTTLFVGTLVAVVFNLYWKEDAVKAGHAEYYIDSNNQRQWRWKEIQNK